MILQTMKQRVVKMKFEEIKKKNVNKKIQTKNVHSQMKISRKCYYEKVNAGRIKKSIGIIEVIKTRKIVDSAHDTETHLNMTLNGINYNVETNR